MLWIKIRQDGQTGCVWGGSGLNSMVTARLSCKGDTSAENGTGVSCVETGRLQGERGGPGGI